MSVQERVCNEGDDDLSFRPLPLLADSVDGTTRVSHAVPLEKESFESAWQQRHRWLLYYHNELVEREFIVFFFNDCTALRQYALNSITSSLFYLIIFFLTVYPLRPWYVFFCGLNVVLSLIVMISVQKLNRGTNELLTKTWQRETETDELQLFREDQEVYRRSRLHEGLGVVASFSLTIFSLSNVVIRPECAGVPAAQCQHSFNAEALFLVGLLIISVRQIVFTRSLMCVCVQGCTGIVLYFLTNEPVWEHRVCFALLTVAQTVGCVVAGWLDESRVRASFEQYVSTRITALDSAKIRKRTKEALAAQVPPGAGLAAAVKDRDGIWGATATMAVCGVSMTGFHEWSLSVSPYDVASLLHTVFVAADDALVASGTAASRYHALGDCYDVGLELHGETTERAAQLRSVLQFAVLAAVAATSAVDTNPELQRNSDIQPKVRTVLHVGSGCSVTLWATKNVVLGGSVVAVLSELRNETITLGIPSRSFEVRRDSFCELSHHDVVDYETTVLDGVLLMSTEALALLWSLHELPKTSTPPMAFVSDQFLLHTHLDSSNHVPSRADCAKLNPLVAPQPTSLINEQTFSARSSALSVAALNGSTTLYQGGEVKTLSYCVQCVVAPPVTSSPSYGSATEDMSGLLPFGKHAMSSSSRSHFSQSVASASSEIVRAASLPKEHTFHEQARMSFDDQSSDLHGPSFYDSFTGPLNDPAPNYRIINDCLCIGRRFEDPEEEQRYVEWARAPFDLPSNQATSLSMMLFSFTVLGLKLVYFDSNTWSISSSLPYAIACAATACLHGLLVLKWNDATPKWALTTVLHLFFGFATLAFILAPNRTALGMSPVVAMVLLQCVRSVRPVWFAPFVSSLPGLVYCTALLVLCIVDPQGSAFHYWTERVWYTAGLVQGYLITVSKDRGNRERYLSSRRAQDLSKELTKGYQRFEKVIEEIAPKGVAHWLVQRAIKPPQRSPTGSRSRSIRRMEKTRRSLNKGMLSFDTMQSMLRIPMIAPKSTYFALIGLRANSRATLSNSNNSHNSHMSHQSVDLAVRVVAAAHATVAARLHKMTDVQLVKASLGIIVIASSQSDPSALIEFACRVHSELERVDGLMHRVLLSSGCVVGSVLGSHSVSFEYYGPGISLGLRILQDTPWGSIAALSSVIRSAALYKYATYYDDEESPETEISFHYRTLNISEDDAGDTEQRESEPLESLETVWSTSHRVQLRSCPPFFIRWLLKAKTTSHRFVK